MKCLLSVQDGKIFFPLLGSALGVLVFYIFPKEEDVSVY